LTSERKLESDVGGGGEKKGVHCWRRKGKAEFFDRKGEKPPASQKKEGREKGHREKNKSVAESKGGERRKGRGSAIQDEKKGKASRMETLKETPNCLRRKRNFSVKGPCTPQKEKGKIR